MLPKTSIKSSFLSLWSQEEESGCNVHHGITSFLLSRQAGGGCPRAPLCHLWNRVRAVALKPPLQVVHTQAGLLRFSHNEEESGECYTKHPDPAPLPSQARPSQAPGRVPVLPIAAPPRVLRWHLLVPLARSLGAWLALPVRLGGSYQVPVVQTHQTRLCDSVRPASPQVQGHPVHFSQTRRCSCLACGNRSPTGEGTR